MPIHCFKLLTFGGCLLRQMGFPDGSAGKESAYSTGDADSIHGLGRSLKEEMATHSRILDWKKKNIPWTEEPEQLNTAYYDSYQKMKCYVSRSVMSDSLQSNGLQHARLLCPWDSIGKTTGVGCHSLLQGISLTQ